MFGARIGSPMAAWFDRVAKGCLPSLCLSTHPAFWVGSSNWVFHFHTELFWCVHIYLTYVGSDLYVSLDYYSIEKDSCNSVDVEIIYCHYYSWVVFWAFVISFPCLYRASDSCEFWKVDSISFIGYKIPKKRIQDTTWIGKKKRKLDSSVL